MRAADKRLVLFSDHIWGKGRENDGLPYVWDWCVENEYGSKSKDPTCPKRDSSEEISDKKMLFIQNYQGSAWEAWGDYDELNESDLILQYVHACQVEHSRLPNFIAVDWAEFGNDGGPLRAVEKVNAALAGQ
jgi:hypothetical protein